MFTDERHGESLYFDSDKPGFEFQLHLIPAVEPSASYFRSLSLIFLTHEIEIISTFQALRLEMEWNDM